jgi:mannitol-1-phosphate/altronate dehydrogenase
MTAVVTPANATPPQVSCDTSQGNGPLHQTVITAFAQMPDSKVAECGSWEPRFPNARVDRIRPLTTTGDRLELINTVPASYARAVADLVTQPAASCRRRSGA